MKDCLGANMNIAKTKVMEIGIGCGETDCTVQEGCRIELNTM